MFCSPGSVGKSPCCVMVAASISRSHGHSSDATTGSQQRTTAAGPRVDRPLYRQPHAATGSITTTQSQSSSQNPGASDHLQLKINPEPPSSLPNLVASNPSFQGTPSSSLYLRNKRFKLWGNTRTALSTLFQANVSYLRRQRKHKKSWKLLLNIRLRKILLKLILQKM